MPRPQPPSFTPQQKRDLLEQLRIETAGLRADVLWRRMSAIPGWCGALDWHAFRFCLHRWVRIGLLEPLTRGDRRYRLRDTIRHRLDREAANRPGGDAQVVNAVPDPARNDPRRTGRVWIDGKPRIWLGDAPDGPQAPRSGAGEG